ncbi:MAG: phosphodiesterase [Cyanobacteria bacterium RYN_339]|nr:phosphodiesterase [Cyanobacteria bacterium RYN_339]
MNASDLLHLLGFSFLFLGIGAALYFYLPIPKRQAPQVVAPRRSVAQWVLAADAAELYPPGHARRVADLAARLAEAIALPEALRPRLEQACLLHDLGMVDVPPALVARPGFLTQAELFQIWDHPADGAARAGEAAADPGVGQWVRWHHERWDGLGYPDGLAGSQIPLPARILRLADTAEAMLQPRPYRPGFGGDEVIAEINRLAGVAFDPELARIFVDYVLPRYLEEQAGARPRV